MSIHKLTMSHIAGQDAVFRDAHGRVMAIVNPLIARRLFACWDACKDISTESLVENGVVSYEFLTGEKNAKAS